MWWYRASQAVIALGALISLFSFVRFVSDWELSTKFAAAFALFAALVAAPFAMAWMFLRRDPRSPTRIALTSAAAVACIAVAASQHISFDPNSPNGNDGLAVLGMLMFQAMIVGAAAITAEVL